MRAAVADLTSIERRGTAYGIFNTIYGLSWLFGGAIMGFLYEIVLNYLILFAVLLELISIFFLLFLLFSELQQLEKVKGFTGI
jgi:MFS family permease